MRTLAVAVVPVLRRRERDPAGGQRGLPSRHEALGPRGGGLRRVAGRGGAEEAESAGGKVGSERVFGGPGGDEGKVRAEREQLREFQGGRGGVCGKVKNGGRGREEGRLEGHGEAGPAGFQVRGGSSGARSPARRQERLKRGAKRDEGALAIVSVLKMKEKEKKRLKYWEALLLSRRQLAGGLPEGTWNFGGKEWRRRAGAPAQCAWSAHRVPDSVLNTEQASCVPSPSPGASGEAEAVTPPGRPPT